MTNPQNVGPAGMAGNHTPHYIYICPLSEEERQVQAMGYPWVTIKYLDRLVFPVRNP
jgi:hypothetical protein